MTEVQAAAAPRLPPSLAANPLPKSSIWQSWKDNIGSDIKKIGFAGLLVTCITAYFQNISAYQDKVATIAKEDMQGAATTFSEALSRLSRALSLQNELIVQFYEALPNDVYKDNDAYLTKEARGAYKDYAETYTTLREDYNLLARKAEIFLDWASDKTRDPATNAALAIDPMTISKLGAAEFDCEENMPNRALSQITLKKGTNNELQVDWNSAKHHILTIEYCFDVTHKRIIAARQWASASPISQREMEYMTGKKDMFRNERPTKQTLRLNAFMNLATAEIEDIRAKYRPTGFFCNLPVIRELMGQRCNLIRTAGG